MHCVAGSAGAEFHPDLKVVGVSVKKGVAGEDGYSGFTMRDLVGDTTGPPFWMGLIYLSGGAGLTVLLGVLLCHTLFV